MSIEKIQKIAGELKKVQRTIKEVEDTIAPLKETEDALRSEMLLELKKMRLSSYKGEDGINYSRAYRSKVVITNEMAALPWAIQNACVKIDSVAVARATKGKGALPPGFGFDEIEMLRVSNREYKD